MTGPLARAAINALVKDMAAAVDSAVRAPGVPEQATVMRRHLRMIVGTRCQEISLIEALASELFNNAIVHSRSGAAGGEVCVVVIKLPGRVQVKVIDQGPVFAAAMRPQTRAIDLERALPEGGFGLRLVNEEATRWGVINEPTRTTVWFEVARFNDAEAGACARHGVDPR